MRFTSAAHLFVGPSLLAFCSVAHAQAVPADATAQGAGAPAPDAGSEIVVTAQRRAEAVTKVPISITVANQAQLERQQVNTFNDLNRVAPSLEIQAAPGQNTGGGGSIRGIGTQTFSAGAVASVGVVVDQVSQGNANISDLFDVARVEVLKGPQGTLFGLTTSAGVINITTNAPDPTRFSARIRSELSDAGTAGSKFGNQVVQGVVNIPLSQTAALRVAGTANLRQGVDRNALTGHYNDIDHYSGRSRLLWKPTDRLTINAIGDYAKSSFNHGGDFFTFVKAGGPGILPLPTPFPIPDSGVANQLASCGVTAREGNQDFCSSRSINGRSRNYGGSLEIDYAADPFTLTSITSYRGSQDRGAGAAGDVFRADPLEIHVYNGDVHRNLRLFTQEFRISSPSDRFLEYTAGVFLSHQRSTQTPESLTVELTPFPGVTIPVVNSLGAYDSILDESMAVFGQGTFHITPKFRLIAGGRYTAAKLALDQDNLDIPAAPLNHEALNTEKVSYRFGAQYDLTRKTMVYATASRGFKGGQIALPSAPDIPYVVRPEIPTAYEAGLKTTLLGGWVLDLNAFYEKIKDFQAQQCTVNGSATLSCVQTNIDGVKTRGAEINLFGRVFQGLSVNTGFIFAKATYPKEFLGTDGTNIGGTQLAYAPKYKFTFSGQYDQPITERFKGFVAGDAVWKSRIRYEANSIRDTTFRPHWLVGGRIGAGTSDDRYQIAIFVRNLFNVHEPSLMQSSLPYNGGDNVGAIYGPQSFRQVGLSLDAKF